MWLRLLLPPAPLTLPPRRSTSAGRSNWMASFRFRRCTDLWSRSCNSTWTCCLPKRPARKASRRRTTSPSTPLRLLPARIAFNFTILQALSLDNYFHIDPESVAVLLVASLRRRWGHICGVVYAFVLLGARDGTSVAFQSWNQIPFQTSFTESLFSFYLSRMVR